MAKVDTVSELPGTQKDIVHLPTKEWSDEFAGKVVVRDFERAEAYRTTNHDWRFRNADDLYVAHAPQKTWEGTRIPRSALGVYLSFQQIESFLPKALQAIFGNDPWFDVNAQKGTPPEAAEVVRDVLIAQYENCQFKENLRRSIKDGVKYGTGIIQLEWLHTEREVNRYTADFKPKRQRIRDLSGNFISVPTGKFTIKMREEKFTETENRPIASHVSIKQFYIDPHCPSPIPQDARYCIRRVLTDLDEIAARRGQQDWTIPSNIFLNHMATDKPMTEADNTLLFTEASRQGSYDPRTDSTLDPGGHRAEVLHYWTKSRYVQVIRNGATSWVIFNQSNPFGFIPFYAITYADMSDRFYGQAMSDVLEGEQRFQQAVLNARIDELALSIHPPTVKHRGINVPQSQLRQRPGALISADDPSKHVIRLFPTGATSQAFVEQEASENRAQKITGLNDLVSGAPARQNPALRTATGANALASGAFSRIQYFVENVEMNVLQCMLADTHKMNQRFLDPNQLVQAVDGRELDPLSVFNADVRFKMRAGSKMTSRQALSAMAPPLMQLMMNPLLLQQLATQGQTVDFPAVFMLFADSIGYTERIELIRDMTQQEVQAMQQSQPDAEQTKLQLQQERMKDLRELSNQEFEQDEELQGQKSQADMAKVILQGMSKELLKSASTNVRT